MDNNEFYRSSELNKNQEFKRIPAEIYPKKLDINKTSDEIPDTGKEYTYTGKNNRPKQQNATTSEKLLNKISNSVSTVATTVATTATVVASVVMFVAIIVGDPIIDLLNLNITSNSVEYSFELKDLDSEVRYYLNLESENYYYETELFSGKNIGIIIDLSELTDYDLCIVGIDMTGSKKIYYETSFKTLQGGPSIDVSNITSGSFYGLFDISSKNLNDDKDYLIIIQFEEDIREEIIYKDTKQVMFNDLMPDTIYSYKIIEQNIDGTNVILTEGNFTTYKPMTLEVGDFIIDETSISYNFYLESFDPKEEYYLLLTSNESSYQKDIVNGHNEGIFNNLESNVEYTFMIMLKDDKFGDYSVFEEYITTKSAFKLTTNELVISSNDITYDIVLENIDINLKYYLEITQVEEIIETIELVSGNNKNQIFDLLDNTTYKFNIYSLDQNDEKVILYEESFTTSKIPLPTAFEGEYLLPTNDELILNREILDSGTITNLSFSYYFTTQETELYKYRIRLMSNDNILDEVYAVSSDASQTYEFSMDSTINVINVVVEVLSTRYGEEKVYETFISEEISLLLPILSLEEVEFVSTSIYNLAYMITSTNTKDTFEKIDIVVNYPAGLSDPYTEEYTFDNLTINQKDKLEIMITDTSIASVTFTATLTYKAGYTAESTQLIVEKEHTFENVINLKNTVVDSTNQMIMLEFDAHIAQPNMLVVVDADTNDIFYLDGNTVYVEILEQKVYNLKYYMTNEAGDILSTEQSISVDTTTQTAEYTMSYVNPGEYAVTINDDKSINLYAVNNFSSLDPDVYYEVVLEKMGIAYRTFRFNTNQIIMEDLPDYGYSLQYNVYKEVNGVKHLLHNEYPSGTIIRNSALLYVTPTLEGNNLSIVISNSFEFDQNSIKVIDNFGNVVNVTSDMIVLNPDASEYQINGIILAEGITSYTIIIDGWLPPYTIDDIESVITLKGNKYETVEIEIII